MNDKRIDHLVNDLHYGRISRRQFIKSALAVGLSTSGVTSLLAACAPVAPPAAPAPAPAGQPQLSTEPVRFLIAENFWADWEPYQSTAQSQARLNRQIYDHLVEIVTPDVGQVEPGLATSWEQLDELTWELKLHEGVKFHNGQAFTAADVKASIERASGATDVTTVSAGNWVPTTVESVDDFTVRLKTASPFGPFLVILSQTEIVSAEDIAAGSDQLKKAPNGTGPFRVVGDETTRKEMEATPDYWRGEAQIKQLIWEFIQDAQTRLNALLAGQAHAIDRVPPEHLQVISNSPDLVLSSQTAIEAVMLWVHPGRLDLWTNNQKFREAVNWSIDRESLVRDLVQGQSRVMTSFLPWGARFHQSQSPAYTFDPDKAKAALEAAGVPDGGPEFELWGATGFQPRAKEVVEAIANTMQQVGLKPKIVMTDVAGVIDDIFSENGTGLMYHLSWSSSGDPHNALFPLASPFVWSDGDARIDQLVQDGAKATNDAGRETIYAELQEYFWQKLPHVPLYNSDFTVAHTQKLEGLRVLPNFNTDFYPARLVQ
jgi:peptide/nickel transport system substrate-binding protein